MRFLDPASQRLSEKWNEEGAMHGQAHPVRPFLAVASKKLPDDPTFQSLISCIFLRSRTHAGRTDEMNETSAIEGKKYNRRKRETRGENARKKLKLTFNLRIMFGIVLLGFAFFRPRVHKTNLLTVLHDKRCI